jgi:hypothetical protein
VLLFVLLLFVLSPAFAIKSNTLKVPIRAYRVQEQLFIDILVVNVGDATSQQEHQQLQRLLPDAQAGHHLLTDQFNSLMIHLNRVEGQLRDAHSSLTSDLGGLRLFTGEGFSKVAKSVGTISRQAPVQMWHFMNEQQRNRMEALGDQANEGRAREEAARNANSAHEAGDPVVGGGPRAGNGGGTRNPAVVTPPTNSRPRVTGPLVLGASLSAKPKSLHDLWTEWTHGLGGHKPASDFTAAERGANKCTYCRRNCFWSIVCAHIRAGSDANRVINKVYAAYGTTLSVTQILKRMQADKKNGGHPNLKL